MIRTRPEGSRRSKTARWSSGAESRSGCVRFLRSRIVRVTWLAPRRMRRGRAVVPHEKPEASAAALALAVDLRGPAAVARIRRDDAASARGTGDDAVRCTTVRAGCRRNASGAATRSCHHTAPIRIAVPVCAAVRGDDAARICATRCAGCSRNALGTLTSPCRGPPCRGNPLGAFANPRRAPACGGNPLGALVQSPRSSRSGW